MACLFQLVSHLGRDEVSLNFLFTQVNLLTLLGFFFWLWWVLVAAHGLSLVAVSRGCSLLQCTGFSLQWLLLVEHRL